MKIRKTIFAGAVCIALCALMVLPAFANSAESYWEGVSASGVPVCYSTPSAACPRWNLR